MPDTHIPLTSLHIRDFDSQTDSIEELTRLLNKSYQTLAEMGFRFVASHQDAPMTLKRMENAHCLVGLQNGKIIATILYYPPASAKGAPWYDQPNVAKFGQFAVDPEYRRQGIGDELIRRVEEMAVQDDAKELALDTAEGAHHLIRYYTARGYRLVAYTQWNQTNYRSVLMSKKLT
ncbi:GNAT family N-acetyltransferase [Brevibacillus sp. NRS-1366]|uniref:GNAT family N-acetyltransferase n=1 Tax=Brevibacillus sp. NRS-1366 TaxID=3233899 RepID=UPI003D212166